MKRIININTGSVTYQNTPQDLTGVMDKLTELEINNAKNKFDITLIKTQQTNIENDTSTSNSELVADVNNLRTTVNSIATSTVNLTNAVAGISSSNTDITTTLNTLEPKVNTNTTNINAVNARIDLLEQSSGSLSDNIIDSTKSPEPIVIHGNSNTIYIDQSENNTIRYFSFGTYGIIYDEDTNKLKIVVDPTIDFNSYTSSSNIITITNPPYDYMLRICYNIDKSGIVIYYDNTILYYTISTNVLIQINTTNNIKLAGWINNIIQYVDILGNVYNYDIVTLVATLQSNTNYDNVVTVYDVFVKNSLLYIIYSTNINNTVIVTTNDFITFNQVYTTSAANIVNINVNGFVEYISNTVYSYYNATRVINNTIIASDYCNVGIVSDVDNSILIIGKVNTECNNILHNTTPTAINGAYLLKSNTTTENIDITIKKTNINADYILSVIDQNNNAVMLVDNNNVHIVNDTKTDYINIGSEFKNIDTRINTLEDAIGNVDLSTIENNITIINTNINTLNTNVTTNTNNIITNTNSINSINSNITTISNNVANNTADLITANNKITTNTTNINALSADLIVTNNNIITVDNKTNTNNTNISNLTTKVNTLETTVGVVESNVTNNTTAIGTINTNINNINTSVTTNTTNIDTLFTTTNNQFDNIVVLESRQTGTETTINNTLYTNNVLLSYNNGAPGIMNDQNVLTVKPESKPNAITVVNGVNQIMNYTDNSGNLFIANSTNDGYINVRNKLEAANGTPNQLKVDNSTPIETYTRLGSNVSSNEYSLAIKNVNNTSNGTTFVNNSNVIVSEIDNTGDYKQFTSTNNTISLNALNTQFNDTKNIVDNYTKYNHYSDGIQSGSSMLFTAAEQISHVYVNTSASDVIFLLDFVSGATSYITKMVFNSNVSSNLPLITLHNTNNLTEPAFTLTSGSSGSSMLGSILQYVGTYVNTSTYYYYFMSPSTTATSDAVVISISNTSTFTYTYVSKSEKCINTMFIPNNGMYFCYDNTLYKTTNYDLSTRLAQRTFGSLIIASVSTNNNMIVIQRSMPGNLIVYIYNQPTNTIIKQFNVSTNIFDNITRQCICGYLNNSVYIMIGSDDYGITTLLPSGRIYKIDLTTGLLSILNTTDTTSNGHSRSTYSCYKYKNNLLFSVLNYSDSSSSNTKVSKSVISLNVDDNINHYQFISQSAAAYIYYNNISINTNGVYLCSSIGNVSTPPLLFKLYQTQVNDKNKIYVSGRNCGAYNTLTTPSLVRAPLTLSSIYSVNKMVYYESVGLMDIVITSTELGFNLIIEHLDDSINIPKYINITAALTGLTVGVSSYKLVNVVPYKFNNYVVFVMMPATVSLTNQPLYFIKLTISSIGAHTATVLTSNSVTATGPFKSCQISSTQVYIESSNATPYRWGYNASTNLFYINAITGPKSPYLRFTDIEPYPLKPLYINSTFFKLVSTGTGLSYTLSNGATTATVLTLSGTVTRTTTTYEFINNSLYVISYYNANITVEKYTLSSSGSTLTATFISSYSIQSPYTTTHAISSCVINDCIYIQAYGTGIVSSWLPGTQNNYIRGILFDTIYNTFTKLALPSLNVTTYLYARNEGGNLIISFWNDSNVTSRLNSSSANTREHRFIISPNRIESNPIHINVCSGDPILVTDGYRTLFQVTSTGDIITPLGSLSNILARMTAASI